LRKPKEGRRKNEKVPMDSGPNQEDEVERAGEVRKPKPGRRKKEKEKGDSGLKQEEEKQQVQPEGKFS
jgi:hypothetical protein